MKPLRIGIVGGGQLGKMLTIAAKKMGFYVAVIDPTPQSPAGQVADLQIVADYKDAKAIQELAKLTDVLTFEIELASSTVLDKILKSGKNVQPNPRTLGIIRDKLLQKKFLLKNRISTSAFIEVTKPADINLAVKTFGYPFMLKARTDAYDGRGNYLVSKEEDIEKGLEKLTRRPLYIEKFVPFIKEIAVTIARTPTGKIALYPVVETIHKDNICDTVIAPANISKRAKNNALKLARKTMKALSGAGVFAIEMFLTKDDKVLVNEIAPRPHNSGHYSIEACSVSQFEQHIRAILNLPLIEPALLSPAVMINIIGEDGSDHPYAIEGIKDVLAIPGASLHIYGKMTARKGRKLGHITVVDSDIEHAIQKARKARSLIKIKDMSGING